MSKLEQGQEITRLLNQYNSLMDRGSNRADLINFNDGLVVNQPAKGHVLSIRIITSGIVCLYQRTAPNEWQLTSVHDAPNPDDFSMENSLCWLEGLLNKRIRVLNTLTAGRKFEDTVELSEAISAELHEYDRQMVELSRHGLKISFGDELLMDFNAVEGRIHIGGVGEDYCKPFSQHWKRSATSVWNMDEPSDAQLLDHYGVGKSPLWLLGCFLASRNLHMSQVLPTPDYKIDLESPYGRSQPDEPALTGWEPFKTSYGVFFDPQSLMKGEYVQEAYEWLPRHLQAVYEQQFGIDLLRTRTDLRVHRVFLRKDDEGTHHFLIFIQDTLLEIIVDVVASPGMLDNYTRVFKRNTPLNITVEGYRMFLAEIKLIDGHWPTPSVAALPDAVLELVDITAGLNCWNNHCSQDPFMVELLVPRFSADGSHEDTEPSLEIWPNGTDNAPSSEPAPFC